ncbi:MAG: glycoside hydrolase family 2, partial [Planctomycetaceae bacterium]|nr:glycoside hydrolase family 2 [Planctomycetaceae bacterium]
MRTCVRTLAHWGLVLGCLALVLAPTSSSRGQEIVDTWKYVLRRPAPEWRQPIFDEQGWISAPGGFGTPGTPEARMGTLWNTDNIWLRKSFQCESIPKNVGLLIHHDEEAEVYLNGKQIAAVKGYSVEYEVIRLDAEQSSALKTGKNVLAVHCH